MSAVLEQTYDEEVDAAYFRYSNNKVAETVEFEEAELVDYIVDLDEQGQVVGLEVLNYSDHADELNGGASVLGHLNQHPGFHLH